MLQLPKSTEFNMRIPKQKFYDNLSVTPALKRSFIDQIRTIWWRHKIAVSTVNLAPGEVVAEIQVFEIKLVKQELDEAVLRQIDREIPYHILYILECDNAYQAWIGYKESSASNNFEFRVVKYYHTDWMEKDDLPLSLEGLSLDAVYENFVRQVAGNQLEKKQDSSLLEDIELETQTQRLSKEILRLDKLARAEKQPKKKFELVQQIRKLQQDMEALNGH